MTKKMYVGNVCYSTTEDSIRELFSNYGEVISVDIIRDKVTGKSRGFAFVKMAQDEEANNAIKSLDGYELDGRKLRVNEAKERTEKKNRNFRKRESSQRYKRFKKE